MFRMHFYVTITPNGAYHVQNAVAGLLGQHHVHSKAGFERWRQPSDDLVESYGDCDCGLQVSQVRDHTGHVWNNPNFE